MGTGVDFLTKVYQQVHLVVGAPSVPQCGSHTLLHQQWRDLVKVYFQPNIDILKNKKYVSGCEYISRWVALDQYLVKAGDKIISRLVAGKR